MRGADADRSGYGLAVLAICLISGAALSVLLGQDISWDKQNYHLYNAWAFLHDRHGLDIIPASMQTYFNPLLDIPYFYMASGPLNASPRMLAAVQGLWFGMLMFVTLCIAKRLAQLQSRRFSVADICAALIGASGTMAVSQAGSTSNEIQLAVFVLLGLYILMPLLADSMPVHPGMRAWTSGLCCGLAVGLKPTAMVYVPAMGLALPLAMGITHKRAWLAVSFYALGSAMAFLLAYGAWGWHLYETTGNPAFPMFNQVFHSSMTTAADATDGRFRPRNLEQWLFYPFYWMKKQQGLVTEMIFADRRYALAMLAAGALLAAKIFRKASPNSRNPATTLLLVFVSAGYVLWLGLFSILRYAVSIEALTGILMLCAIHAWWPHPWHKVPVLAQVGMALLLVLFLRTTAYPDWWRSAYTRHVLESDIETIEPGSLVIMAGIPNGFLATLFPNATALQFVGIAWLTERSKGYGLWDQTQRRLAEHQGPMYVIHRNDDDARNALATIQEMLPNSRIADCKPIHTNMDMTLTHEDLSMGLVLCRLQKS